MTRAQQRDAADRIANAFALGNHREFAKLHDTFYRLPAEDRRAIEGYHARIRPRLPLRRARPGTDARA